MSNSQANPSKASSLPADLKAEQALGLIGLGLLQKMSHEEFSSLNWANDEDGSKANLASLKQRLELTALAIETGAPLSTSEVSQILGARPGSAKTQRGGLIANRISRNVWKVSKAEKDSNYWRN